jgi:predicted enzyme related to lactoylglutathione lyase
VKNPLSHFEIYADDPAALANFYSALFDWTVEVQSGGNGYILAKTVDVDGQGRPSQAGGINGGIVKRPDMNAPRVINYVDVESLEGSIERARALGAKVEKTKTPVPAMGWFAILSDPQGNPFALWQRDPAAQ